jgi:hypothetical protein
MSREPALQSGGAARSSSAPTHTHGQPPGPRATAGSTRGVDGPVAHDRSGGAASGCSTPIMDSRGDGPRGRPPACQRCGDSCPSRSGRARTRCGRRRPTRAASWTHRSSPPVVHLDPAMSTRDTESWTRCGRRTLRMRSLVQQINSTDGIRAMVDSIAELFGREELDRFVRDPPSGPVSVREPLDLPARRTPVTDGCPMSMTRAP